MKKILSFILALILILSTCLAVSAVDSDTALEQKFYDYCAEVLPENMKPAEGVKVRIEGSLETAGVEFFVGRCGKAEKKDVYKIIGDWRVYSGYAYHPYDLGIYVSSGDEIYTLEEAYEAGYVTDLSSLQYHQLGGSDYLTFVNVKNEDKYADLVLPMFLSDIASDFGMYVSYYEGYEYYSPDNTATGDEATADYVLITYYTNLYLNAPTIRVIGDYVMMDSPSTHCPYEFGKCIYVPAENRVYSISEAYRIQLEGIEKVFTEGGLGKRIGDMDKDRVITIKDATYIQKCIAGLEQFALDDDLGEWVYSANADKRIPRFLSDFNRDGERNIKDATAIQKYIAGLEY